MTRKNYATIATNYAKHAIAHFDMVAAQARYDRLKEINAAPGLLDGVLTPHLTADDEIIIAALNTLATSNNSYERVKANKVLKSYNINLSDYE